MSGNVWEWTQDWYSSRSYTGVEQTDPVGPSTGDFRVYRGGAWSFSRSAARLPNRNEELPSHRADYLGLRLVRIAP